MSSAKILKIGIQGVQASFHDAAAREYFKTPLELCECSSFRELCQVLVDGKTDLNVMAIENSIAGSILPNYSLLEKFKLKVVGEIYLRIEMNLMALPGQSIQDLQSVQSHAMALFQCEDFLAQHPWLRVLEAADTAESAKDIKNKNLQAHGAIASALAAEVYGLEILARGIETNKQNYTRFLVVSRSSESGLIKPYPHTSKGMANKASLRFEIAHKGGSLLSVLQVFHEHKINMTKLQSVPLLGRPYEYSFHVDIEWDDRGDYLKALKRLEAVCKNLFHFGEYPKSERPEA
jgi:prephenate dehydratase